MCFSVQVNKDLKDLSYRFSAEINQKAFDNLDMLDKNEPGKYQYVNEQDDRIYAKIWAPIICSIKGQRQIRPMRYQLLPHFCDTERYMRLDTESQKEIEIKNTYNARLDRLRSTKAWRKPFMNFHAILPIKKFYEWVPRNGHKSMISFTPQHNEYILAPCIYDNWFSQDKKKIIQSFAIITEQSNPEVQDMGNPRSPISLIEDNTELWLNPSGKTEQQVYEVLNGGHRDSYSHKWMM